MTYSEMGLSSRSAGEPDSMRSTLASVLVAKNWKMLSMQRALMLSQSRNPRAYAAGQAGTDQGPSVGLLRVLGAQANSS